MIISNSKVIYLSKISQNKNLKPVYSKFDINSLQKLLTTGSPALILCQLYCYLCASNNDIVYRINTFVRTFEANFAYVILRDI